jgi:hypothetical protein
METGSPWDRLTNWLPFQSSLGPYGPWIILGGGALVGLLLVVGVLGWLFRRPRDRPAPEEPQERLAEFPPAPAAVGAARAHVENLAARVRLVIVAPVGKQIAVSEEAVGPFLNQLVRGLGDVLTADRPRVRIWPSPLSVRGFAPTFFRGVVSPDPRGRPSHWVLLAGPTKIGSAQMLLGLALYADQPNNLGNMALEPNDWRNVLRVGPP